MLLHLLEAATTHGINRIDLGQGDERYKQSFANTDFAVAEGTVGLGVWNRAMCRTWIQLREMSHSASRYAAPLRVLRSVRNRLIQT